MYDITRVPDVRRARLARTGFAIWLGLAGVSGAWTGRGFASAMEIEQAAAIAILMFAGSAFAAWLAAVGAFVLDYVCARDEARLYVN